MLFFFFFFFFFLFVSGRLVNNGKKNEKKIQKYIYICGCGDGDSVVGDDAVVEVAVS